MNCWIDTVVSAICTLSKDMAISVFTNIAFYFLISHSGNIWTNVTRRHAYKAWKFRKLSSCGIFLSISGYIINHAYTNNDIPSFILRSRSYFFEHNLCYYLKSELIIISQIDFFLIILRNTCLLCKAGRSPIECS